MDTRETLPAAAKKILKEEGEAQFSTRSVCVIAAVTVSSVELGADLAWASANAASLLHVTTQLRKTPPPTPAVLEQTRESAMQAILNPETEGSSQ